MDYIHINTKPKYSVTGSKQDQSHVTYGDRKRPVKNSTGNHSGTAPKDEYIPDLLRITFILIQNQSIQ